MEIKKYNPKWELLRLNDGVISFAESVTFLQVNEEGTATKVSKLPLENSICILNIEDPHNIYNLGKIIKVNAIDESSVEISTRAQDYKLMNLKLVELH